MNKNDKFHGAEFEVSAHAISDEELDSVAGGTTNSNFSIYCSYCYRPIPYQEYKKHESECDARPNPYIHGS